MPATPLNPKCATFQVATDADLGTGSLASLSAEGFPLSLGFDSVNYVGGFQPGDVVISESTGNSFLIADGAGGRCAVLTASATLGRFTLTLFVDAGAPTGGDGSVARPFRTIQAALNAAVPGTAIIVTAGTYTENLTIPNTNNLAIIGAGRGVTIIQNSGDSDTVSWVRAGVVPAIATFEMRDLTIRCSSTVAAHVGLRFDASGEAVAFPSTTANAFCTQACSFVRVDIYRTGLANPSAGAALLNRVGYVTLMQCKWYGEFNPVDTLDSVAGTTTIVNCSRFELRSESILTSLDATYNRLLPQPAGGRDRYSLGDTSRVASFQDNNPLNQGWTILRGHPIFLVGPDCLLQGSQTAAGANLPAILGVGLTNIGPGGGTGPAAAPIVSVQGTIGGGSIAGSGVVNLPLPAFGAGFTPPATIDFSRAQFLVIGPAATPRLTITITAGSPAAQPVGANLTRFVFITSGGSPIVGAVSIGTVGGAIAMDARGATWNAQTIFTFGAGSTMDRNLWSISSALTLGAGNIIVNPAFPTADYNVLVQPNPGALTPVSWAISGKLGGSFNQIGSAAVPAFFQLVRS